MDYIKEQITQWLKEILAGGIESNLSGMFDTVNQKVGEIAGQVGQTPQGWNGGIFSMIKNLSEDVYKRQLSLSWITASTAERGNWCMSAATMTAATVSRLSLIHILI